MGTINRDTFLCGYLKPFRRWPTTHLALEYPVEEVMHEGGVCEAMIHLAYLNKLKTRRSFTFKHFHLSPIDNRLYTGYIPSLRAGKLRK